jgi:hypothetical protein
MLSSSIYLSDVFILIIFFCNNESGLQFRLLFSLIEENSPIEEMQAALSKGTRERQLATTRSVIENDLETFIGM